MTIKGDHPRSRGGTDVATILGYRMADHPRSRGGHALS